MKKRVLAALLTAATVLSVAGCSNTETSGSTADNSGSTADNSSVTDNSSTPDASTPAAEEGKVLNIWSWNDEFKQRVTSFYPGYVDNGDTGMIGDVKVVWTINANKNNGYQTPLDAALADQANKAADEKIDLFLMEIDYANKYVNSPYVLPVADLGITDADTAQMYNYTKEIGTNKDGKLTAVSWQATPGLFAYRRSIAKDVLGTDDPAQVQELIGDWDKFDAVAQQMEDKGYFMLSGYDDAFRVYNAHVSAPWVNENNEIIVDDNILNWVKETKKYTENGWNNGTTLWSDGWGADQAKAGKAFGFFYSTWGINFTLVEKSADAVGDWAVCEGPEAFYWGGSFLAAGYQTDNKTLVADIMRKLTCDAEIMEKITSDPKVQDYTNNMAAMEKLGSSDFQSEFLGGQNHIALFTESAKNMSTPKVSPYDQACCEKFMEAMHSYFAGTSDFDTAIDTFYSLVTTIHPELKAPATKPTL